MSIRPAVTSAAAALVLAGTAAAQEGPSIFTAVSDEGRLIEVGAVRQGRLQVSDPLTTDGRRVQVWSLAAAPGTALQVDMWSDDFDTYLYVVGPDVGVLQDDDSGGDLDSRLCFSVGEGTGYRIVAAALGSDVGDFTLAVAEDMGSCEASTSGFDDFGGFGDFGTDFGTGAGLDVAAFDPVPLLGALEIGGVVNGMIEGDELEVDGRAVQGWTLEGDAGDRLAIDLESDDFDAYLRMIGPGYPTGIVDDDGGEGLDSRLCVELPESATYRVYAGPLGDAEVKSAYTLTLRRAEDGALCDGFERGPAAALEAIMALPTQGRALALESEVEAELLPGATRHPETGRPVQPWTLDVPAAGTVTVDVVSYAFDPVLYVAGGGLDDVLYNDDGDGPGCQSRITFTVEAGGTVTLLPGSLYEEGAGPFTLRASTNPGPLEDGGCTGSDFMGGTADPDLLFGLSGLPEGELEVGLEVEGVLSPAGEVLSNGSYAQLWTYEGVAGEEVVVVLHSDDFDAYLYLDGPGLDAPLADDDGAGGLNSRIEASLPESGSYRVVASSLGEQQGGSYRLYVVRRAR